MQLLHICFLLALGFDMCLAKWLKRIVENYHRPTYYNKGHNSQKHVDYSRTALEERDKKPELRARSSLDITKEMSWYMSILHHESLICAGTLISQRMVITSTTCFQKPHNDNSYEYKAIHLSVLSKTDFVKNREIMPHQVIALYMPISKYNGESNHIALLALKKKLTLNYHPLKLYRVMPRFGDHVIMTYLRADTRELTFFKSMVLNIERCHNYFDLHNFFEVDTYEANYFCVRNKRQTKDSTCNTRAGDPLIVDNQLAGVNIFGERCEEDDIVNMDIYLPMRPLIPFIQLATDTLRALTNPDSFNDSPLVKFLKQDIPNVWVGEKSKFI
ncbi:hypothetical protein KR018_011343 [Drosophila ironensis]|nr:hypothetical protein KR018_011343 [Drosophila ironensis]